MQLDDRDLGSSADTLERGPLPTAALHSLVNWRSPLQIPAVSQLKRRGTQSQDSLGYVQDALVFLPNSGCPPLALAPGASCLIQRTIRGQIPTGKGVSFHSRLPSVPNTPKTAPHVLGPPNSDPLPHLLLPSPIREGGFAFSWPVLPKSETLLPPSLRAPHTWLLSADTSPRPRAQRTRGWRPVLLQPLRRVLSKPGSASSLIKDHGDAVRMRSPPPAALGGAGGGMGAGGGAQPEVPFTSL